MAVTPKRAHSLALSLENASAHPHFDRIAFRTPRRIYATLALSGADINFMFDLTQQAHFCALAPHAISPVPGGWGRMGATRCDLALIDAATFSAALEAAHARANAPKTKSGRAQRAPLAKPSAAKPPATKPSAAKPSAAKPSATKPSAKAAPKSAKPRRQR